MSELRAQAVELLAGSYDLHTHATPSHFPRVLDDFQLLKDFDRFKVRGVMFKCHNEPTISRAIIANLYSGAAARAYGSITLNWPVGGLNPFAVESALKLGAKMVWMPTIDTALFMSTGKPFDPNFMPRPGLVILDDKGGLLPEVHEIFEVVKKFDVCLATGHISPQESVALCKAGCEAGVRMILTHPDFRRTPVPFEIQAQLADLGVIVEKVWLNVKDGDATPQAFADSIKKLGIGRSFLTSDRGQAKAETPADAMLEAVQTMLENGLTETDLRSLIQTVSEEVLGK